MRVFCTGYGRCARGLGAERGPTLSVRHVAARPRLAAPVAECQAEGRSAQTQKKEARRGLRASPDRLARRLFVSSGGRPRRSRCSFSSLAACELPFSVAARSSSPPLQPQLGQAQPHLPWTQPAIRPSAQVGQASGAPQLIGASTGRGCRPRWRRTPCRGSGRGAGPGLWRRPGKDFPGEGSSLASAGKTKRPTDKPSSLPAGRDLFPRWRLACFCCRFSSSGLGRP